MMTVDRPSRYVDTRFNEWVLGLGTGSCHTQVCFELPHARTHATYHPYKSSNGEDIFTCHGVNESCQGVTLECLEGKWKTPVPT